MPKSKRMRPVRKASGALATLLVLWPFHVTAAPSEAEFTQDMLARIRKLTTGVTLEVAGPLSLRVSGGSQDGGAINFDRIYAFCEKNDAAACEEQKDRFASGMASSLVMTDTSVTPGRLRVVVRNADYAKDMNAAALGKTRIGALVIAPVAAGVDLVLAADFPQTTRLVGEDDLKSLGLSRDQAIALGTKQVLAALPPLPDAKKLSSGVSLIAGQDYGASYLLAADQWRARAKDVTGILWIAIPADERVVMGVARDEAELARLKPVVANDFATAPRGISPLIYRWTDKGWLPLR